MKRRVLLTLIPLAASALACQAATSVFGSTEDIANPTQSAEARATLAPPSATGNSPETPTAEARDGEVDPCSLLTNSQVGAVYGQPPGEPVVGNFDYVALGAVPSCTWPQVRLELSLPMPPQGEPSDVYYAEYLRRMDPQNFPQGLGDEAWGDPQDGDLLVRDGDFYFMLEEHTFDIDAYERTQALAKRVLANLGGQE